MAVKKITSWLFARDYKPAGLWPIEWLTLAYLMFTSLLIAIFFSPMDHPSDMFFDRIAIVVGTLLLWRIYCLWPVHILTFFRVTAQMVLLAYWYPDTYEFNRILTNLDHIFAYCDDCLWGCQPSMAFSQLCPWQWFSELMNLGYFSYYPMILSVMVFFFFCRNRLYFRVSFVVMCSFFLFYIVFIFLPVAGPQYYFCAVDMDVINKGVFPALGHYFNEHVDMLSPPGYTEGFFYRLVSLAQDAGERPTAAFPSSHVGITFILLFFVRKYSRSLFWCLVPFAVLLLFSTVYIQAHYFVDALAGLFVSYPIYKLSLKTYFWTIKRI